MTCCWKDGELALIVVERVAGLIEHRLRNRGGLQQHRIAIVVFLVEIDLRLLSGDVTQHALIVLLHGVDRHRGLGEIGVGILKRDLKLTRIEAVENLASFDVFVVLDRDVLHDAGHVGRDADAIGLHICVVGRHDLTAGHVGISADEQNERQQRKQRPAHAITPAQAPHSIGAARLFLGALAGGSRLRHHMRPRAFGGFLVQR